MRNRLALALGLFALCLPAGSVGAGVDGWHKSMDDGLAAAADSGRPVLVVTAWKEKV